MSQVSDIFFYDKENFVSLDKQNKKNFINLLNEKLIKKLMVKFT